MKKQDRMNNIENTICSILHGVGRFSCSTGSQEKVLHHRGATLANPRGITLIALVITIIILLILAGVVLTLTIGEHGIINMAKQAGEEYKIAGVKERVEEEIMALEADKIVKGEKLTVEQALIGIEEKEVFEEIDLAEEIGISEGYEIKLGYNEFENVIILGIEKETGIRIVTNVTPKGYTNKDVVVTISVKPEETKISNIETPKDMEKQADGTYKISKNGTYLIKATLEDGTPVEKEIKINTIDILPPKEFEITAQNTGTGFIISGETVDEEATEENVCSGIDYYEYVVIDKDGNETTYKERKIKGLKFGKYQVYARAYDKAGNPSTETEKIKVEVTIVIDKLSLSESHCLAIDKEGNLWVEGDNKYGQLGTGDSENIYKWIQVMEDKKFKEIETASHSSYAIDVEGNLYAWGRNRYGNLGDGTTEDKSSPVLIKKGVKFKKVEISNEDDAGSMCTAIDINDNLWIWGTDLRTRVDGVLLVNVYEPIKILEDIKFKDISVGKYHYLAIDEDGRLWTWGNQAQYGFLGRDYGDGSGYVPTKTFEDKKFKKVYASKFASFAIDEEGNLYSWGRNYYGLLGIDNSDDNYITKELQKIELNNAKAIDISGAGINDVSVAILDENGDVWTIGSERQIVNPDSRLPYKQVIGARVEKMTIGRYCVCFDGNNDMYILKCVQGMRVIPTQKRVNPMFW